MEDFFGCFGQLVSFLDTCFCGFEGWAPCFAFRWSAFSLFAAALCSVSMDFGGLDWERFLFKSFFSETVDTTEVACGCMTLAEPCEGVENED